MKITLTKVFTICAFIFSVHSYGQNTMTPTDFNVLMGEWTGTLTYMDYSSSKPFTMPANLTVEQGKNENQLVLFNSYPNEPHANSKDKIQISKDGSQVNNIDIKSVEAMPDGQIQIMTTYIGKDNKKRAQIRNVYNIGNSRFVIRKEVKFENSENWLVRNEYKYVR